MQVLIQQVGGGGQGFFISYKLPGDTDAAGAAGPKPTRGGAGN